MIIKHILVACVRCGTFVDMGDVFASISKTINLVFENIQISYIERAGFEALKSYTLIITTNK